MPARVDRFWRGRTCVRIGVCLSLSASLVLAAGLQVELVDLPEVEVVGEGEHAHLLDEMQFARAVKVEDGGEGARVAVEEVLVVRLAGQERSDVILNVPLTFSSMEKGHELRCKQKQNFSIHLKTLRRSKVLT